MSKVSGNLAFPGAEGFGALATGGQGGETVHVTTLEDAGPGSFREAVSQPKRVVVFDVSGVITLKSNVQVSDDVSILGETAPGKGITLYNRTLSLSSHKNIIVRYLRCREGIEGDSGKCAINMATVSNVILDHCSIEWGRWDSMGLTKGSHDVTVQDCIIGASIDPQRFGALVDTVHNVTLARNLWIHNHSRNPKVKGTIQYINNVVYDWGITGLAGGHSATDHWVDVIGNYFIKGPDSNDQAAGGFTSTDHVYSRGNLVDLNRDGKLNGVGLTDGDYTDKHGAPTFVGEAWGAPQVPVAVMDARRAYAHVIAEAGCSKERDATDLRLIAEVKSLGSQGHIMHSDKEAGLTP
ncbi:MAG: pectate lyase family protein [Phycisphaerae bacterium]